MHNTVLKIMIVIFFLGSLEVQLTLFQPVGRGGGQCAFKWILCGHFKPTPSATISIMLEVISIKFWQICSTIDTYEPISLTQTFIDAEISTLKWCIWPFLGYLCPYKFLCQRYWLIGVYGTSKLPKFYRNDFKHDLYCCTWCWLQMSA